MARAELHSKTREARYRQIADELLGDIRAGRVAVGETLPSELELLERYEVSRHTMREAMRMLTDLGVVQRRPRAGTVVRARMPQQAYLQTVRSPADLLQYPPGNRLLVQSAGFIEANAELARLLLCPKRQRWWRVRAVRRFKARGAAICWLDLHLLPEYSGITRLIGRRSQPVYEMIEQKYGEQVAVVRVDIRAGLLTEELAGPLGSAPGQPSLTIIRRYVGRSGRVFQVSVSEHPADRYNYQLELKRGWEAGGSWSIGASKAKR